MEFPDAPPVAVGLIEGTCRPHPPVARTGLRTKRDRLCSRVNGEQQVCHTCAADVGCRELNAEGPEVVGVPKSSRPALTESPAGNPVASNEVGLLVPVI